MKNRLLKLSMGLVTSATLTACGSGSTGSVPASHTISGQFLDAEVSNLHYDSLSNSGETNAVGRFTCKLNEEVTFSIGSLILGRTTCQRIVTPQTIAATVAQVPAPAPQTTTSASGVVVSNGNTVQSTLVSTVQANAPEVVNRVRLLMTLDIDSDPANGIQLPALAEQNNITRTSLDFTNAGNSFDNAATTDIIGNMPSVSNRTLVDALTAETHFNNTLTNIIPTTTATPGNQPATTPINIGQYYDDDTGDFDEEGLETEHNEFNEQNERDEHGEENEHEDADS